MDVNLQKVSLVFNPIHSINPPLKTVQMIAFIAAIALSALAVLYLFCQHTFSAKNRNDQEGKLPVQESQTSQVEVSNIHDTDINEATFPIETKADSTVKEPLDEKPTQTASDQGVVQESTTKKSQDKQTENIAVKADDQKVRDAAAANKTKSQPSIVPPLNVTPLKAATTLVDRIKQSKTHNVFILQAAMLYFMGQAYNGIELDLYNNGRLNSVMKRFIDAGNKPIIDPISGDLGPLKKEEVEQQLLEKIKQAGAQPEFFSPSIKSAIKTGLVMRAIMNSVKNEVSSRRQTTLFNSYTSCISLLQINFQRANSMLSKILLMDEQNSSEKKLTAIHNTICKFFETDTAQVIDNLQAELNNV